jgi:hypothetical protein
VELLPGQEWLRAGELIFRRHGNEVFRLSGVSRPGGRKGDSHEWHCRLWLLYLRRFCEVEGTLVNRIVGSRRSFKSLFDLDQHVWHRGLNNNRTQMLAAILAYQLLVRYNYRCGNKNGQVKWIVDKL